MQFVSTQLLKRGRNTLVALDSSLYKRSRDIWSCISCIYTYASLMHAYIIAHNYYQVGTSSASSAAS